MKKALSLFCALSTSTFAAPSCAPKAPATCYPDQCTCQYCLGSINYQGNAPVCPQTCNGDLVVHVAGFYWNAHQDGMEFALRTNVQNPFVTTPSGPTFNEIQVLNRIIEGQYFAPHFKWDWGFKVGGSYCTTCDGWDVDFTWTWFRNNAHGNLEAEIDTNQTLLPLWSAFAPANGSVLFATEIDHQWKLECNLYDIELGRKYWTSKYLSLRPHIGLRIVYLTQHFDLQNMGGSWNTWTNTSASIQASLNNYISLKNHYHGVGIRAGLNSEWNLGCGWALYGKGAGSIIYGRFEIDHYEYNVLQNAPYTKYLIADTDASFRSSRAVFDYALGIQWSTLFCDCQYGFKGMIGWEQMLFLHLNQFWRVVRLNDTAVGFTNGFNNSGENGLYQRRGNLDTQGWTLTIEFSF